MTQNDTKQEADGSIIVYYSILYRNSHCRRRHYALMCNNLSGGHKGIITTPELPL